MKKVIFTNQKGGVGKTTLTREVGLRLAETGKKVLLIDADPQGNLTKSLVDHAEGGLYEAFEEGRCEPVKVRDHLELLAGDMRLSALERRYLGEVDAYGKLSELFDEGLISGYDLVLIDSPPSLGVMTLGGLAAAGSFVIPVRPALYSLQGTNDLLSSVAKVKKSLNPRLQFLGVVVNDVLTGPVIGRQILSEIAEAFGEKLFQTVVRRTVKVEEAIAAREAVGKASSRIGRDIAELTEEITGRLEL